MLPPEAQVGRLLGVSRTVVREAMRILVARGLVEISQGRPARVKAADPDNVSHALGVFLQRGDHSMFELVEVRRPLESEIAALAARRATPEQLAAIIAANEQMSTAGNLEASVQADIGFHGELARATGNAIFGLLLHTLSDLMRRSRRETIARTGVEEALRGHRAIIQALQDHDPEAARWAMLDHLARASVTCERPAATDLRVQVLQPAILYDNPMDLTLGIILVICGGAWKASSPCR